MDGFVANIRVCKVCGKPIPAERIKALPQTETCALHSSEEKRRDILPDGADLDDLRDSVQHGPSGQ